VDTLSDKKITRLVATHSTTRVYELEDGNWLVARNGTVAWRDNNPGNLKFEFKGSADSTVHSHRSKEKALESARSHYDGIVDLDQWGNAIFESYEAGRSAQKKLLLGNGMADKTVDDLVKAYSKADYSGATHYAHQASVIYATAEAEGHDLRGKKVEDMTTAEVDALADGVAKAESWRVGTTKVSQALTDTELTEALHSQKPAATRLYRQGDHGEVVGRFQQELATLGFTSATGQAIKPDGDFGPRTKEAVIAFQKAHALTPDGVIGHDTAAALKQATLQQSALTTLTLDNPQHPGHPIYRQALTGVCNLDEAQGRATDFRSYNLSGALALAARNGGLERIDQVMLSDDASRAFAVQNSPPLRQFAHVGVVAGISTPLAQSSTDWMQFQAPSMQQAQAPTRQAVQAPQVASPSM
jgi:murein L,D-transpeptidase YcbB/YkuD